MNRVWAAYFSFLHFSLEIRLSSFSSLTGNCEKLFTGKRQKSILYLSSILKTYKLAKIFTVEESTAIISIASNFETVSLVLKHF